MFELDMNSDNLTQNATNLVRLTIERDGVLRNALQRGIANTRAVARDIEARGNGSVSFDAVLSAIRRYPSRPRVMEGGVWKENLKLSLRNRISVVSLKNSNDLQNSILRFSGELNSAGGETFRLVTNLDNASVTIDTKNLDRFKSFISDSQINRILGNLSEIIVEMPIEIEKKEGILSAIVTELSMNDVVIRQFTTIGPGKMIILVDESDATRAFDALQNMRDL